MSVELIIIYFLISIIVYFVASKLKRDSYKPMLFIVSLCWILFLPLLLLVATLLIVHYMLDFIFEGIIPAIYSSNRKKQDVASLDLSLLKKREHILTGSPYRDYDDDRMIPIRIGDLPRRK